MRWSIFAGPLLLLKFLWTRACIRHHFGTRLELALWATAGLIPQNIVYRTYWHIPHRSGVINDRVVIVEMLIAFTDLEVQLGTSFTTI